MAREPTKNSLPLGSPRRRLGPSPARDTGDRPRPHAEATFEDTDDPGLGVEFAIEYPQTLAQSAVALLSMAIAVTDASATLAEIHRVRCEPHWPAR